MCKNFMADSIQYMNLNIAYISLFIHVLIILVLIFRRFVKGSLRGRALGQGPEKGNRFTPQIWQLSSFQFNSIQNNTAVSH